MTSKRLLLTGATGLIGRELAEPLIAAGFDVYALTIDKTAPSNGFHWLDCNLFDAAAVRDAVAAARPSHLLNLAWATTGDYLKSDVNYSFLQASISLAREFAAAGGRRAVFAGTCFEYDLTGAAHAAVRPLKEDDPLDPGKFDYTFCKDALRRIAGRFFASRGVSFAYGRIFYAFGRGEAKSRFAGVLLDRLSRRERMVVKNGPLVRDYIYSRDIARAFAALLDCDAPGVFNICTGKSIPVRDFALAFARRLGAEDCLAFEDDCAGQPPRIEGDAARISSLAGFSPQWTLERAVAEIVAATPR